MQTVFRQPPTRRLPGPGLQTIYAWITRGNDFRLATQKLPIPFPGTAECHPNISNIEKYIPTYIAAAIIFFIYPRTFYHAWRAIIWNAPKIGPFILLMLRPLPKWMRPRRCTFFIHQSDEIGSLSWPLSQFHFN